MAIQPPTGIDHSGEGTGRFLAGRWYLFVVGVTAILGLVLFFRCEVSTFIDRFANLASVLGLLVSIIGFALTLWTVYETRRVSRNAQCQIEKEIAAARKETQQAIEKIALQLLQAECESIYRLLTEARRAILDSHWERSVEKCHEAKQAIVRLGAYRHLESGEKTLYATGADDLQATIAFIERNRLRPNAPARLPSDKLQPLDTLLTLLERTRSRLLQLFLEIPYADQS